MTQIKLAGNLISATGPLSHGHLQIIRAFAGLAAGLVAGLSFGLLHPAMAQTGLPEKPPAAIVFDPSAFLVPRDQLSTQDSDPFLFISRVMDSSQPRWAEFEPSIARFPDTSSCLMQDERTSDVQNLLNFDWKAMESLHDIEVCMFRVAHSLDDLPVFRAWLATQGYRIADGLKFCTWEPDPEFADKSVCSFSAIMAPELFAEKTSVYENISFPWRQIYRHAARRHDLNIGLSATMQVVDVDAGVITQ